jgi:Fe-S oxidoreductase
VKEDLPSLLRGEQQRKAREAAKACVMFEEFAGKLDLPLRQGPAKILVHGHCHQKSMGLLPATMKLLSRIPGSTVIDLDAGCCGMAGSFGYDPNHYDVSVAVANRKLLPAIREMQPGDVMVAPGTSCRQQVKDLGGKIALHPAELVRSLLK